MSYPKNFCTPLTDITNEEWYKSIVLKLPQKIIFFFNLSLGILTSTTPNLEVFYGFWKNTPDVETLTTAINVFTTPVDECSNFRSYHRELLNIFFCNSYNINNQSDTPILGGTNTLYFSQLNNLYYYFKNQGGVGLTNCEVGGTLPILQEFCTSIIPDDNNQSVYISSNKNIYKWCGCYSNPSPLNDIIGNESDDQKLACNPLCNFNESIDLYEQKGTGYQEVVCTETVCAIDNVSLKVVDSDGSIKFNQICPGCKESGNCLCIIDSSVEGILDKIETGKAGTQDPVSFNQVCPNSQCYVVNSKGEYNKINCNNNNVANTNKNVLSSWDGTGEIKNINSNLTDDDYYLFVVIVTVILLFMFLSYIGMIDIIRPYRDKKKRNNIYVKKSNKFTEIKGKYVPKSNI